MRIDYPPRPRDIFPVICHHRTDGPSRSFPDHFLRVWLLYYTEKGSGHFRTANKSFNTEPNEFTLIRPGVEHYIQIQPEQQWTYYPMHFHEEPRWEDLLHWPEVDHGVMRLKITDSSVQKQIDFHLHETWTHANSVSRNHFRFALAELHLVLLWADQVNPRSNGVMMDDRVRRAIDFMVENLGRQVDRAEISASAGTSASHLSALFQEHIGTPIKKFLEDIRIVRAQQLLQTTSLRIHEISDEVGFTSPFYFSTRFQKRVGVSPMKFRQKFVADQGMYVDQNETE